MLYRLDTDRDCTLRARDGDGGAKMARDGDGGGATTTRCGHENGCLAQCRNDDAFLAREEPLSDRALPYT